jgi:glycosyltransferase involved in cell wall biosynthesis
VSLVSLRKKDLSEETLEALGVDITYLERSKFDPLTLPAMLKIVDRKKIDILHLHGYGATTFGRIVGAMRGIPTIVHEHANLTDTPWFQKVADRLLEPSTDIALAVSKSTADFVINARLIPESKVKVVYLGVPLEEFSRPRTAAEIAAARRELGVRDGEFAIGTITRLHDSKGNSYLIDAAASVVNARPAARFFLVGEGPLLGELEAQAAALGLGGRFVFAGFRRDVAGTLSAFDLSVFPSLWEGTPITAFEALAIGKPIVATDADGLLDILTDQRDAMIVPKRNASALADKIVWMIDRPEERARLSAAARETGRQYDIDQFVRKMERLYTVLHEVSRATRRRGVVQTDLSFLTSGVPAS